MAIDLLTKEEIDRFMLTVQCCTSNQFERALNAKSFGKGNWECEYKKALYLEGSLCLMSTYYPIGYTIQEAVSAHDAIAATVELDLSVFTNNGAFFDTTLTIGGVNLIPTYYTNTFYDSIDGYGGSLDAAIDFESSNSNYEASYDASTKILTISSTVPGASLNGAAVVFQVKEDKFVKETEFSTLSGANFTPSSGNSAGEPQNGVYDPILQKVVFASTATKDLIFTDGNTETSIKPEDVLTSCIVYNSLLTHFIVCDYTNSQLMIYDSGYNLLGTCGTAIRTWEGLIHSANGFAYFPNEAGTACIKLATTTLGGETGTATTINYTSAGTTGRHIIKENPVTTNLWILDVATNRLHEIDSGTDAVTEHTAMLGGTSGRSMEFVNNGGVYELWIGKTASVLIFNAATNAAITTIDLTGLFGASQLKQSSSDNYVYIVTGSTKVGIIDPVTRAASSNLTTLTTMSNNVCIVENTDTTKMYIGEVISGGVGWISTWDLHRNNYDIAETLDDGEDAVITDVPAIIVAEDDGYNCLSVSDFRHLIEMVKRICC